MNNSSTGGIIQPHPQPPTLITNPPGLNLVQFIQTLFTGLSAFPGNLVRPDWQTEMPKQPDINVNWLAFGIGSVTPDANAYTGFDPNGVTYLQRNELLELTISVYGPQAYDNVTLIRDGLQIPQNMAALRAANMGFAYDSPARHIPDLVNERWIDRYVMEIFLRRQIQRFYPIVSFLSASGIVFTQTAENADFQQPFASGE